jgi:molybdopterin converting factor subunit 1
LTQIRVLFFAILKDLCGVSEAEIELPPGTTVAQLRQRLQEQYPPAAEVIDTALVALDREFAFDEDIISEISEAALFPPVSGGDGQADDDQTSGYPTNCQITDDDLDLNGLISQITLPSTGAACLFTGVVRAITTLGESRQTNYLEYESYQDMAVAKLHQVAAEIRERWAAVEGIVIIQRIGRLEPGTPTVVVGCTAAHRDSGVFEAARYGIDRLKEIVPVWKKEVGPQGQEWVEGSYNPTRED